MLKILSICTGAGLWDRAWQEWGHFVVPGCEIDPDKRALYHAWMGTHAFLAHSLEELVDRVRGTSWDLVIGGPPCQSHSKLRAMRGAKFPDLSNQVDALLDAIECRGFIFENVAPVALRRPCATVRLNAMHFPELMPGGHGLVHQSRVRVFTYSKNITPPRPPCEGSVDDLMAYPVVAGRIYGPRRGAVLQGWPEFARLQAPCALLQDALASGVPRAVGLAWVREVEKCF